LHHTKADVPHFGRDIKGEEFEFVKGAISTIDRAYHPVFNYLHHEIGNTHVI
jgi:hypothetical protein